MSFIAKKNIDYTSMLERYREQFEKYGYSPMALGWDKGKQNIRFEVLTSFFDFENKSVLDLGCGFGDLNRYIRENITRNYSYTGIDMVPEFISMALELKASDDESEFILGNFMTEKIKKRFDIVLGSGIFNHKFTNSNNYEFIRNAFLKSYDYADEGVAFDFLTSKVEYELDHAYYSDPTQILSLGLLKSNKIIFKGDYFPFEFAMAVYKNQEFDRCDTTYTSWKSKGL
jgi:SAM-dependent methyltransferase